VNPRYLRLELDTPYTVALRYPEPKIVNGFAGKECRWILMDGQALYTPESLKEAISAFKPGERFTIWKLRVGRSIEWKLERAGTPVQHATPQPIAAILERSEALDPTGDEIPRSRLEDALRNAVTAAAAAEKHGAAIGYTIRFQPADVRAMAISVLIGMQQRAA
jgi:hypothetical protein